VRTFVPRCLGKWRPVNGSDSAVIQC
jgi:hypothetical protein